MADICPDYKARMKSVKVGSRVKKSAKVQKEE
jgi:hypothetical protein